MYNDKVILLKLKVNNFNTATLQTYELSQKYNKEVAAKYHEEPQQTTVLR